MKEIARFLIYSGAILIVVGCVLLFFKQIPVIGKLPGDIHIEKKNFSFYFPITTSILLSIILSFVFWLVSRK